MEAALNYSRKFGDHNVTGLVLYNQSKRYYPGGTYDDIPSAYVGFVGRATYDYKTRYMAEFNVGYNGSENLLQVNVMACSQLALLVGLSVKSLF